MNNGAFKDEMAVNGGAHAENGALGPEDERQAALTRMRTAGSISMTPELFEKLYLTPQRAVKGELRKTFANPTPIGLVGFLLSLSPLAADLMEWRGPSNNGASSIGVYIFMGGLLMVIAGIFEWVIGNSFSSLVFFTFGGFWFSYAATLIPSFAAYSSYAPTGGEAALGIETRGFNAGTGYFSLFMGVVCFIFLIGALRTNLVYVGIFLSLTVSFLLQTGGRWAAAENFNGNAAINRRCAIASGAFAFVACVFGWYLLTAIVLSELDFPLQIPVGDLSTIIKGRTDRRRSRGQ